MAITVKDKIFNLETKNTLYQMKVDRFGVLNHLWYGEKTDCCMDYLLDYPDAGFSGNIYEAEQEDGRILRSLKFRFPIFFNEQELYELDWDNESTVESVLLMRRAKR